MAEWRVNLQGDDFDLEQLALMLTSPGPRIRREEGSFFLTSDRLNALDDAHKVREVANEMLQSLNGLARLRLNARKPLSVGNLQRVEDDGKTHCHMVAESAELSLRGSVAIVKIGEGGATAPVQQADTLFLWFSLAQTDETVARVLRMYGKAVQPWRDFYPIYEIIEHDVGGEKALVSKGWTSRNQIERFNRTADNSKASGENARHGVSTNEPPTNPMTTAEAKEFIDSILSQWLTFKQGQQTP